MYRTIPVTPPSAAQTSQGGASGSREDADDSISWDYPQQTGLSVTGEESAMNGSGVIQEEEESEDRTGASGSTRMVSGREDLVDVTMVSR